VMIMWTAAARARRSGSGFVWYVKKGLLRCGRGPWGDEGPFEPAGGCRPACGTWNEQQRGLWGSGGCPHPVFSRGRGAQGVRSGGRRRGFRIIAGFEDVVVGPARGPRCRVAAGGRRRSHSVFPGGGGRRAEGVRRTKGWGSFPVSRLACPGVAAGVAGLGLPERTLSLLDPTPLGAVVGGG